VEVTTADSVAAGTILGAERGIEGKLPLVMGGNEGLLSLVGMLVGVTLAEAVVLVDPDVTTSFLGALLFKLGDDSLTGVGLDGRELDMVPSGTVWEVSGIDVCDERMEETVGDETFKVFAADACVVDEAAEDEAPDLTENEDGCSVGENVGGWGVTSGVAFTGFCTVSLTPLSCEVFTCNTSGLEGSEDKDGLLRSPNIPPVF
jgi:hypothetical protein